MRRAVAAIQPRLLTPDEAAAYLGYTSTAVLASIPVEPLRLSKDGVRASPRYDLHALDAWLDNLSGIMPVADPATAEEAAADEELNAWRARRAARR